MDRLHVRQSARREDSEALFDGAPPEPTFLLVRRKPTTTELDTSLGPMSDDAAAEWVWRHAMPPRRVFVRMLGWSLAASLLVGAYCIAASPLARAAMLEWVTLGHGPEAKSVTQSFGRLFGGR